MGSAVPGIILHATLVAGTAGGLVGFGAGAIYGIFSDPRSVPLIGNRSQYYGFV